MEIGTGTGTGTGNLNEWFKLGSATDISTPPPFSAFLARWMIIRGALLRKRYECEEHCSYHSFQLNWAAITLLEKWPEKKFSLWTVFEPTALALPAQCSTNWAIKATERSCQGLALYVCRSQQTTGELTGKFVTGVSTQSNEVTTNRVTGKNFEGSKILNSFKNMLDRL